jgi:hypothetical protein
MATVNPTTTTIEGDGSVVKHTWSTLTSTNTDGAPAKWSQFADRSVQMSGTWGGATVTLQGSNDGLVWFTLGDPQANGIAKTSNALEQVLEMTHYVRPLLTGGDGTTAVSVILMMRRANNMRS